MRVHLRLRLLTLTLLALYPASSYAQSSETAVLTVTAKVQTSCAVNSATLNFGTYTSGQSSDKEAQGKIEYDNCSGTISFELDGGNSGDTADRTLTSGSNTLDYQLYRNSSRSSVFGTGGKSKDVLLLQPSSGSIDVYGSIAGGQTASPGSYSDTVNITLTF